MVDAVLSDQHEEPEPSFRQPFPSVSPLWTGPASGAFASGDDVCSSLRTRSALNLSARGLAQSPPVAGETCTSFKMRACRSLQ